VLNSARQAFEPILDRLPSPLVDTAMVRALGLARIPMIAFCRPRVLESGPRTEIVIPLTWRTKNHLNCMYFGALAVGADLAVGFVGMKAIHASGEKVSLIFKDFKAEYTRRATGDVHFVCDQGPEVDELVQQAISCEERVERCIDVVATVPSESDEPVANFQLTLSLKRRP
jgi:hypothetical protein